MKTLIRAFILTSALSTGLWALPASAADTSAGKVVENPEAPRAATGFTAKKTSPRTAIRSGSATRALGLDEAATIKSYTTVTRSKDGTETRTEPSGDLLKAIKGEKKADANGKAAPTGAADPALAEEGGARAVIGNDNRIAVQNSTKHPFVAVGYLETGHAQSGTGYGCTATVVGPSTILTAASCVYQHNLEGGWFETALFWPAINGEQNIPFGGPYDWKSVSVFEGFITNHDGTYDSVWFYDLALIELEQPIGDTMTGWMGYYTYPDLTDFEVNMISYNDDTQPAFGQSRSACDIIAENTTEWDFLHECDSDNNWSFGAPLYYYDPSDKTRRVVGLNMGGADINWSLRLHGVLYEWMLANVK